MEQVYHFSIRAGQDEASDKKSDLLAFWGLKDLKYVEIKPNKAEFNLNIL